MGILCRDKNCGLLWHAAQVSGRFFLATVAIASPEAWIWWTGPWQEMQLGASGSPFAAACP